MRKATFAKLSLTAAVGLGTLFHAGTAQAETPPKQLDQTGDIKWAPAPPTTIAPIPADPFDPNPGPDADFPIKDGPNGGDPDPCPAPQCDIAPPPVDDPEPECPQFMLCTDEKAPVPGDDPEPECPDLVLTCDDVTSDPGCNVTHGDCDEDGGDEGTDGGDEGTDDGGDTPECDDALTGPAELCLDHGDEGTDGGSGGSLPKTGGELVPWAIAGLGLTGVGAALRKLGQRGA